MKQTHIVQAQAKQHVQEIHDAIRRVDALLRYVTDTTYPDELRAEVQKIDDATSALIFLLIINNDQQCSVQARVPEDAE